MKITFQPLIAIAGIIITAGLFSCKKNKEETPSDPIVTQIQNILPQKFIDSLKKHGIVVNEGSTPPTINGIYIIEPINDYDNSFNFSPGDAADDARIKISNQSGSTAAVYIKSDGDIDTSTAQIIAGSGNDFTVYAQAKGGTPVYTYDYVMTGTYSATGIVNIKFSFVMVDNGGNTGIAPTGTIRIFHDLNNLASITSAFRVAESTSTSPGKNIFSIK